jgi:hemerythrin-like domain-containing protein
MASIFDHMREEHVRLERALDRLREPEDDPHRALYRLMADYTAYSRAVEHVLYSHMIHIESVQPRALQGLAEHQQLDSLLRRAEGVPAGDSRWDALVKVLCEALNRHLRDEERDLCAQAREALSEREASALGASFVAERARVRRYFSSLSEGDTKAPRQPATRG